MCIGIALPSRVTVDEPRQLCAPVQAIRRADRLRLDARCCERFEPAGVTAVAAALVDRTLSRLPPASIVPPRDPEVHHYLEEVGFYDFFGPVDNIRARTCRSETQALKARCLTVRNLQYVEDVATLLVQRVGGVAEDAAHSVQLCLTELLDNVIEHARSPVGAVMHARWYRYAGNVRISVADLGVGIPESLRRVPDYSNQADVDLVRRVVEVGGMTSRLNRSGGLGLKHLSELASIRQGRMLVLSGKARVRVGADGTSSHGIPGFPGTLVEIDIRPTTA